MGATQPQTSVSSDAPFRHEALFYSGDDGFLERIVPFLAEAAENNEPSLVAVSVSRISMLRAELGRLATRVCFADMRAVGRNPARMIPAWRDFLDEHGAAGRPRRGVGEQIWAARSPAELIECQRQEALLNLAFADSRSWWLMCPYDLDTLSPAVIQEAERSHPYLRDSQGCTVSDPFRDEHKLASRRDPPMTEPARCLESMDFDDRQLRGVRVVTASRAEQYGMDPVHVESLVLAVHEIAANSLSQGGGSGTYRMWREGRTLVCEIRDNGTTMEPPAGRGYPGSESLRGRGLWIANQLCDLVQVDTRSNGSTVRMHLSLDNA